MNGIEDQQTPLHLVQVLTNTIEGQLHQEPMWYKRYKKILYKTKGVLFGEIIGSPQDVN